MSKNYKILIGHTIDGDPIYIDNNPGMYLVSGATGRGKSSLTGNIILSAAARMRKQVQFILLDSKRISHFAIRSRISSVVTNPKSICRTMRLCLDAMERRYKYMEDNMLNDFPISEVNPYVWVIVEECGAITSSNALPKQERERFMADMQTFSSMARSCGMGLIVVCQSPDTSVITSTTRSNLFKIGMGTGPEQAKMICGADADFVGLESMFLPGEFATNNPTTDGWVTGVTWYLSPDEMAEKASRYAGDTRELDFLDPSKIEYSKPDF